MPLLSRSVNLHPYFADLLAWSGGDPYGAGRLVGDEVDATPGRARVTVSNELIGALAIRRFYVAFAAADLEALLASLDRTVALLEELVEG